MKINFSTRLMEDLAHSLQMAWARDGIINIPMLADQLRQRHEAENIALEDISAMLLSKAQLFSAAMEFDGKASI